jgi:hypothetical protein
MAQGELTHQDVVTISKTTPKPKTRRHNQTGQLNTLKRYNLALPEDLFNEVQELANRRQTTVVDLLRRFIKLGLLSASVEERPNSGIFLREDDTEREIIFI